MPELSSSSRNGVFIAVLIGIIFTLFSPHEYFTNENDVAYSFISEWYDTVSGSLKKLQLSFYTKDSSVELYDLQTKKIFLKRFHVQGIETKDFYIGNTVVILSRHLKIIDYANEFTKNEISKRRQRTFAMIKPDAVHKVGEIIDFVQQNGFEITQLKMVHLTMEQARYFYEEHAGRGFYDDLVGYMSSGPIIPMELVGNDSVSNWRKILGPTDSEAARIQVPESLRAKFGTDNQRNAAHGSDSDTSALRELNFFFLSGDETSVTSLAPPKEIKNTCCIIKPHAVRAGKLGKILTYIAKNGYQINALQMVRLNKVQAEEFLEVYKDVLTEYPRMVQQLISGPLVALAVTGPEEHSTYEDFRNFVGPIDPEVARELRPFSLRAKFGEDKIRNGVHCTDLPEDGEIEIEYFFNLLQ